MNTDFMVDRSKIQIDLIKLVSGDRILRLSDAHTGLALEKKVEADKPVVRQKERLLGVFEAALARAEAIAA